MNKLLHHSLRVLVLTATALASQEAGAWTIEVTGTIFNPPDVLAGDELGLFGSVNGSLLGAAYSETITTNPLLNSTIQCATATCLGTAGFTAPGFSAAPYTLTVTVNGISFMQSESAPSLNSAMLVDLLSMKDPTDPAPYDMLSQSVGSGDCTSSLCLVATLQALSATQSFVPALDFNQTITVTGGFTSDVTDSYTAFGLIDGASGKETDFYGTIGTLSVKTVSAPEPGTFALLAAGIASLGLARRRRKI